MPFLVTMEIRKLLFLPNDSKLFKVCQVQLSIKLTLTDLNFKATDFHAKLEQYSNHLEAPLSQCNSGQIHFQTNLHTSGFLDQSFK